jgi:NitT/TauT family transport system ATP-binding protein
MSSSLAAPTAAQPPAPQTPLISVRSLSKSFAGPGGRPLPVLDNITLDVSEGEFVALLGRSGSGKSTLLRCIAGLMAPTSGKVLFRGSQLTGTNRETAMVFQTFALMPWLTVQQNVELGLEARSVPAQERAERALRAIDIVGLDGYESAYPKELSGGMRQRVGFARALVVEPAALLMDEPFSALDVLTSENLRGELLELWEGHRFPTKTIVMVTHNIEEAVLLADRILVLGTNPGRIKSDMVNPLPRPRQRRTPDFDELVDQIYRMMTQRDAAASATPATQGAARGTVSDTPLPQATVDGLSGLAEILLGRHAGAADLADLADSLGLEVDDLLPLVDALVMLGFAGLHDDRLELTGPGRVFAGASIQDSKEIFARACLDRAPLVRVIYRALRGSLDDNLPVGFFTDILRNSYGEEDAARQLDVAVNWGRYAELYAYDASRGQIVREEEGIGASIAESPEPPRRGFLRLYLGAAPGAGKTFTMLREGRALRGLGEDVVIGFVEDRGRPRTTEAVGGLEIVPAGPGGMDVGAVLARKPAVALVDDLGRHAADIEALRSAGVDVISTADVSDIQRVATDVAGITGMPPAATVSDAMLADVDEIQFVDSSPEALRKRLGHGNIYPADQVSDALQTTFRTDRLAALRDIGLSLVAGSAPGTPAVRRREPQDVLVAVWRAAQAEELVRRGVRLARRRGATCTVLLLDQAGQPPGAWIERARAAAAAAGAAMLERDGRDAAAVIANAVQEAGAAHLVLAAPAAGLLERWRGTMIERLAAQLSEVHMHIIAGSGGPAGLAGGGQDQAASADTSARAGLAAEAATAGSAAGEQPRRGPIRVYLGYAPGCGTTTAMLEEAGRRSARGAEVVIAAVDTRDREGVAAELEGLELTGTSAGLDTDAVLARAPEVACIDDLAGPTVSGESRYAAAGRLAAAGITVVATAQLAGLSGPGGAAAGAHVLAEPSLIALADEIELVDVPPSVLIDRVRRGEIVSADLIDEALRTTYSAQTLRGLRERAFRLVAEHGDRLLGAAADPLGEDEAWPSILACAAPWPGMESLIRRAAALAAQVDGVFTVACVPVSPATPEQGQQIADYAALTAQLGGELVQPPGSSAAAALAGYAREHQVTELVLARTASGQAGRYPVLRELVRQARGVELHVLPAEPAG